MYRLYADGRLVATASHYGDLHAMALKRYGARRCAITDEDRNTVWMKDMEPSQTP